MIQPEFFLQLLIVLLNLPTTLRQTYQAAESVGLRQIAEEVFGRFFLQLRPFHQQPYFFMRWFATHTKPCEGCTRTATKRDSNHPFVPCRQRIDFQPFACTAASWTERGRCWP